MFETNLKHMRRTINAMHKIKYFKGKKIYIFGVSDNSRQIIIYLRALGYNELTIIDNDVRKIGSYCMGLEVKPANNISPDRQSVFIIYSFYWREMKKQLSDIGVKNNRILVLDKNHGILLQDLAMAVKGKAVYQRLIRKYGCVPIYLCPYTGTGDIYLIGSFWNEYIERNNIEKYIFVVISGACRKVASLFDISNIELLKKQDEGQYLLKYYSLKGYNLDLKVLNDGWAEVNDNSSEWLRGYKGWNFTDLFRKFVFDLPDTSHPMHPVLEKREEEINELFEKNNLIKGKTIVLSPYSNTLADLPRQFWERLCKMLQNNGYSVCTNCSSANESSIKGSAEVRFPLNIAPQFVAEAGGFIGVRSGFCDVISGADAKKVILYDANNLFYNTTAYEYFNLKNMGLCDDAIEIEFRSTNIDKIVETIERAFAR